MATAIIKKSKPLLVDAPKGPVKIAVAKILATPAVYNPPVVVAKKKKPASKAVSIWATVKDRAMFKRVSKWSKRSLSDLIRTLMEAYDNGDLPVEVLRELRLPVKVVKAPAAEPAYAPTPVVAPIPIVIPARRAPQRK